MNLRLLISLLSLVASPLFARDISVSITFPKGEKSDPKLRPARLEKQQDLGTISLTLQPGNDDSVIEVIREHRYPIRFNPPAVTDLEAVAKGTGGFVAQTPQTFETTNGGWSFTVKSQDGPDFITLNGSSEYTEVELVRATFGEAAGPMTYEFQDEKGKKKSKLLSENAGQSGVSRTTRTVFQLYAKPGKAYKIPLRKHGKTIEVSVKCEYIK